MRIDFTINSGFPNLNNTKTPHLLFYYEWEGNRKLFPSFVNFVLNKKNHNDFRNIKPRNPVYLGPKTTGAMERYKKKIVNPK